MLQLIASPLIGAVLFMIRDGYPSFKELSLKLFGRELLGTHAARGSCVLGVLGVLLWLGLPLGWALAASAGLAAGIWVAPLHGEGQNYGPDRKGSIAYCLWCGTANGFLTVLGLAVVLTVYQEEYLPFLALGLAGASQGVLYLLNWAVRGWQAPPEVDGKKPFFIPTRMTAMQWGAVCLAVTAWLCSGS
jgi:hypothetical protein